MKHKKFSAKNAQAPDSFVAFNRTVFSQENGFSIDGNIFKGIEIFRTGVFRGNLYDKDYLQKLVDNFHLLKNKDVFRNVPVREGHYDMWGIRNDMEYLIGFINDMYLKEDGTTTVMVPSLNEKGEETRVERVIPNVKLVADFEITEPEAAEKIKRGTFRDRSIEWGPYPDNDGNVYEPVIGGVAFVDIPQVDKLNRLFSKFDKHDVDVAKINPKGMTALDKEDDVVEPEKPAETVETQPEVETPVVETKPEETVETKPTEIETETPAEKPVEPMPPLNDTEDAGTPSEDVTEAATETEPEKEDETKTEPVADSVTPATTEPEEDKPVVSEPAKEDVPPVEKTEMKKEGLALDQNEKEELENLRKFRKAQEMSARFTIVDAFVLGRRSLPAMAKLEKKFVASLFAQPGEEGYLNPMEMFQLYQEIKSSTPELWAKKDDVTVLDDEKEINGQLSKSNSQAAEPDTKSEEFRGGVREMLKKHGIQTKD